MDPQKKSGEDFARRIIEVLKKARGEKLRTKEEEGNETKENGLARVLHPARGENEKKTNEKGDKGKHMKPNPQNEILVKQINGLSDKKPREKIKRQKR